MSSQPHTNQVPGDGSHGPQEPAQARDVNERVETEVHLRFRARLLDAVGQAIIVTDLEGTVLYWNRCAEQLYGWPARQVIGRRLQEFLISGDFWERAEEIMAQVRAGKSWSGEFVVWRKDGTSFPVHVTDTPVRDDRGSVVGVVGVSTDITERKRAEEALRESERRFSTLLASTPAMVYRCLNEPDWPEEYVSDYAFEMTGYPAAEFMENPTLFGSLISEEDKQRIWDEVQEAVDRGQRFRLHYAIHHKDGTLRFVEELGQAVYDESGDVVALEGLIYDVTEHKRTEERLREAENRYRTLVERMPAIVYIQESDEPSRTTYVNPQNETILGYTPEECLANPDHWIEIMHPDDRERILSEDKRTNESGEAFIAEYRQFAKDGRIVWIRDEATMVRGESGEPLYWLGVQTDITERKALEERLAHQALHDPLTDLPNRTLFTGRLRQALARAKRRRQSLAVMFMDLDSFKVINDSLGHKVGDRLLVAATKRIRSALRPEDTVARLGGDELVFLLEDTDLEGAIHVTKRILELLGAPFSLGGRQLFVTASIGITVGSGNGKQAADLLRDADLAMYRAKHSGKARYAVFDETMNARALERLELEHGLRRAVERNEFVVHYQPKVSLATGKTVGFEALVRWEHPERGLLLPKEFVPLAEETGLIIPIGEAVLEEACSQVNEWRELRPSDPPTVCVNLSARQFREPGLVQSVARIIGETGLEPSRLFLEVTESTAMRDALATGATLEEIQDLGVRTILDDFGTGYSSLSYLERFPVDYIKIDRSFVGSLGQYPGAEMLVSAMINLARALDIKVIAEGVETEEQLERLRKMGYDLAQGHLFSKPLTAKEGTNLLAAAPHRNPLDSRQTGRGSAS